MPITNNNYTQTGTKENRFLYQGKEWQTDLALNLYDFHARQYDPATGRFTSSDRLAGLTPGWTPYHGMGNNPMLHTDPTGEVLPAVVVGAIWGAALGAGSYVITQAFTGDLFQDWNWGDFAKFTAIGAVSGAASFGVGKGIENALTKTLYTGAAGGSVSVPVVSNFVTGVASGFGMGFTGGFTAAFGHSVTNGNDFNTAIGHGFDAGLKSGISLGITKGIAGGWQDISLKEISKGKFVQTINRVKEFHNENRPYFDAAFKLFENRSQIDSPGGFFEIFLVRFCKWAFYKK